MHTTRSVTSHRNARRLAAVAVPLAWMALLSAPATATSPPPSWTNERILNCDGIIVDTYLTPAGFGTPYHVVGSSDVIVPKHVEVVFPGETVPVTTLDVPGFSKNAVATVHCTYTDPTGLAISLYGVRG
jgi:hypothetical protein